MINTRIVNNMDGCMVLLLDVHCTGPNIVSTYIVPLSCQISAQKYWTRYSVLNVFKYCILPHTGCASLLGQYYFNSSRQVGTYPTGGAAANCDIGHYDSWTSFTWNREDNTGWTCLSKYELHCRCNGKLPSTIV